MDDPFPYNPRQCTLEQAKEWLRARVSEGEVCPCCAQMAKVYRRNITSTAAWALIQATRSSSPGQWLHVPSFYAQLTLLPRMSGAVRAGDWAKLRYWGLIEERKEIEPHSEGPHAGIWRVTDWGREYAQGRGTILKYAILYDGRLLRLEGPKVSIRECLGQRFNFPELMAACPPLRLVK